MRFALAQLNPLVGDLSGNATRIEAAFKEAASLEADVLLTPELSLWGYPPKDLLLNEIQIDQQQNILKKFSATIAREAPHLKALVGIAEATGDQQIPKLFNSVVLVENTGWKVVSRKQLLPNYDVFDETRYFRPAESPGIITFQNEDKSWRLGITICEDLWVEASIQKHRLNGPDPIEQLVSKNIDILINLSASPFNSDKEGLRKSLAAKAGTRLGCPVIYLNQVGANDELIFDGASFILDQHKKVALQLPKCKEALAIWDTKSKTQRLQDPNEDAMEELFEALVLGVRDYTVKCGFKEALIGLSGGIDSSLVAIIAAAALGAENITGILMPSPWSSYHSIKDANDLANRIGIKSQTIPIKRLMDCFDTTLSTSVGETPHGLAAENLQSRIRGTLLMAVANQHGKLLLSTGNKSELAVGYCTLYGDMNGGLSVIGDLYKTTVFDLCAWLDQKSTQTFRKNMQLPSLGEIVGKAIREKAPSAELRENQLDTDSLPDYSLLDSILKDFIEEKLNTKQLISKGHPPEIVRKVADLLKKGEFKRKQAPPVLKVTPQAFGSGWRRPIASS